MKKNIFLTGAAGFIGFHLARFLKQRGDQVLGFDNFNDYYSPQLKRDRAKILAQEGIEIVEGDLCDPQALRRAALKIETTHIVHLAAQAGVRYSLQNPQAYVKSNLEGFVHILEMCRSLNLKKMVYASSSSVYGLNTKVPFSENDPTDHPTSLYGATKKANELLASSYYHLYGIESSGLRFFTVYGPWGRPDMAYYSFANSIISEKPIELFNYGELKRDFTYIDDIIEGTSSALDLLQGCEIFNLGNHRPEPLLNLVKVLEEALEKKAVIQLAPMQPGDVLITYADHKKSADRLGFRPKTSLKEGLQKFVQWYKEYSV